jgi:hypothetical protein
MSQNPFQKLYALDTLQFGRKFSLIVADKTGDGLELGGLKVIFKCGKNEKQTPNQAEVRIYNLAQEVVQKIKNKFTRITLQAGYKNSFGVIYDGQIRETREGKEHGTDTFLDIAAGDGLEVYNYAIVNQTLEGATQEDQIQAAYNTMEGIGLGYVSPNESTPLPRGKVMFGQARNYLRNSAKNIGADWSIQDRQLLVLKKSEALPGEVIILTSKSGLIGTATRTIAGIIGRCLINPNIKIGSRIKIDEQHVLDYLLPNTSIFASINKRPNTNRDGIYRVISILIDGDTKTGPWYINFEAVDFDESAETGMQIKV